MNHSIASQLNQQLIGAPAEAVIDAVLSAVSGRAIVTTNFRPYEAVILHMVATRLPAVDVLWVDHGANLPETYRFSEAVRERLTLNIHPYLPKMTKDHWLALNGGTLPTPDEVERVESFSRIMKLEPFERGMNQLAPSVWITALRREQNPQRASALQPVMWDEKFQCFKVNPILEWTTPDLEAYLARHDLPNERTYYDPAKGDEKHECGLHAALTTDATR